jgi:hypothetical protein
MKSLRASNTGDPGLPSPKSVQSRSPKRKSPKRKSPSRNECDLKLLEYYQESVVERVVKYCRGEFGHLLIHRMGAGKTFTALSILNNFSGEKVVIAPEGILNDGYGPESRDLKFLFGTNPDGSLSANAKQLLDSYEPMTYKMVSQMLQAGVLQTYFADKVIVADEAHKFLEFLPDNPTEEQQRIADDLLKAMHGAKHVVLLTGSPILTGAWNLTGLIALVARVSDAFDTFPYAEGAFNALYKIPARRGYLAIDSLSTNFPFLLSFWLPSAIDAFKNVKEGLTTDLNLEMAQHAEEITSPESYVGVLIAALEAIAYKHPIAAGIAAALLASGIGQLVSIIKDGLVNKLSTSTYEAIDDKKLVPRVEQYVSFFDYETSVPKLGDPAKLSFPKSTQVTVAVPYTHFQIDLLTKLKSKDVEYQLTSFERKVLNIPGTLTADQYLVQGSKIGNVSPDMFKYKTATTTEWKGKTSILDEVYYAVDRKTDERISKDGVFGCVKFEKCLKLLLEARMSAGYETKEISSGVVAYTGDRSPYNYLPIVFSNFNEQGFQIFSAFLTSKGYRHVIVHKSDTAARRAKVLSYIKDGYFAPYQTGAPLCVLLHPDIKEGLDLPFNPFIFVLEPVKSYGLQEQVYARILRRLKKPFPSDKTRVMKYVLQFEMSGGSNDVSIDTNGEVHAKKESKLAAVNAALSTAIFTLKNKLLRTAQQPYLIGSVDTRYFVYSNTPEMEMLQTNNSMKTLLETMAALFSKRDDRFFSQKCLEMKKSSSCTVCPSGRTSNGACTCRTPNSCSIVAGRKKSY